MRYACMTRTLIFIHIRSIPWLHPPFRRGIPRAHKIKYMLHMYVLVGAFVAADGVGLHRCYTYRHVIMPAIDFRFVTAHVNDSYPCAHFLVCGGLNHASSLCFFFAFHFRAQLKLGSTVKKWNRIMGHGGNIDIDSTYVSENGNRYQVVWFEKALSCENSLSEVVINCRSIVR